MKKKVKEDTGVELIRIADFEDEVIHAKETVILLCIRKDYEFGQQIMVLQEVLSSILDSCTTSFKACVLCEGTDGALNRKLDLEGYPTFIIFKKGKEKDRMLGLADEKKLKSFLLQTVSY